PVGVDQRLSESGQRSPSEERSDAARIAPGDVELVAIDSRVARTVDAEMLPEEAHGDLLHLDRIAQRAELIVERDQELQTFLALAQRRLGAGALDRFPGPLADVADELDFGGRPASRRDVVGTEGGHRSPAFDERQADERRDLSAVQAGAFVAGQARIGLDIVDDDGSAAAIRFAHRFPDTSARAQLGWP